MNVTVSIEPANGSPSDVEFRWDPDTDILTANVRAQVVGEGATGSVEIEGEDGSWLVLDLRAGTIHGVEVAVWPRVRRRSALVPPAARDAHVKVRARNGGDVTAFELNTVLAAESDHAERTIHFKLGAPRPIQTVRIARGILLDIDGADHLAGVWLLDVPPFPDSQP